MLDIITKRDFFDWLDHGHGERDSHHLKNIQDAFILSQLADIINMKVAEIGGGNSRVLTKFCKENECWNIDKFEGKGLGPRKVVSNADVILRREYLGDFASDIPNDYFDVSFSISVVEHISHHELADFFLDLSRIMKKGGRTIHAIDIYLEDEERKYSFVEDILKIPLKAGLKLVQPAAISSALKFSCRYASNSDATMYNWNKIAPQLADLRCKAQSVSIKAIWEKQ